LAGIEPGMQVLDAGCGFGGTLGLLGERIGGVERVGLNIDHRQLVRAAGLAAEPGGPPPAFVAGDACALPFPGASFDRVMAVECIFHVPSRLGFLREARRVLRPGGMLVLSDFVPSAAFMPLAHLAQLRPLQRLNLFGSTDVTCTEGGYRVLAERSGLALSGFRDITRNTLPTYAFLRRLLRDGAGGRIAALGGPLIGALDLIARTGLLRYGLLRFERR
jgi:ubiquinone/menaquinone biosynthesis C-methylase UbiE